MIFDDARHEIFLFGGYFFDKENNFTGFNETWTFDGQFWTNHNPAHSPHYGDGVPQPILSYDAAREQVVLLEFGVATWVWNGSDWQQLQNAGEGPLNIEGRLGYDENSQLVILWGKDLWKNHEISPETWQFDGHTWAKADEQMRGPDSPEATLYYDSRQQKLLLFAFLVDKMAGPRITIWEWGVSGWQEINP